MRHLQKEGGVLSPLNQTIDLFSPTTSGLGAGNFSSLQHLLTAELSWLQGAGCTAVVWRDQEAVLPQQARTEKDLGRTWEAQAEVDPRS